MKCFLQQLVAISFMISFCLLPMDSKYKLTVKKAIPFNECHNVAFLEKNALLFCSKDIKLHHYEVFDWKKNKKIEHPLLQYNLFSFEIDCWNRNVLPWHGHSKTVHGYNIQSQRTWRVCIPETAVLMGFSDQDPDSLIIQDNYFDTKNIKIYLLNCKDNSKIFQEPISSVLSKYEQVKLQYYNSNTQKVIYSLPDKLYIHDLKNNVPIKSFAIMPDCCGGQIFASCDNAFAIYLSGHNTRFIDLAGKKRPLLLSDHEDREHASVMIHPNSNYIFTMSRGMDSMIQIWDNKGICILKQKSPTPDKDDATERARQYAAYWNAFSLSVCRKYLAVAFPTQCVIYRLPFDIMYGSDYRERFSNKLLLLKNSCNPRLPRDILWLLLKKLMYVSRW